MSWSTVEKPWIFISEDPYWETKPNPDVEDGFLARKRVVKTYEMRGLAEGISGTVVTAYNNVYSDAIFRASRRVTAAGQWIVTWEKDLIIGTWYAGTGAGPS